MSYEYGFIFIFSESFFFFTKDAIPIHAFGSSFAFPR